MGTAKKDTSNNNVSLDAANGSNGTSTSIDLDYKFAVGLQKIEDEKYNKQEFSPRKLRSHFARTPSSSHETTLAIKNDGIAARTQ